jgi:hypothetical protein
MLDSLEESAQLFAISSIFLDRAILLIASSGSSAVRKPSLAQRRGRHKSATRVAVPRT